MIDTTQYDLTDQEESVHLDLLAAKYGLTVRDLAVKACRPGYEIERVLEQLEELDLVRKIPSGEKDQRWEARTNGASRDHKEGESEICINCVESIPEDQIGSNSGAFLFLEAGGYMCKTCLTKRFGLSTPTLDLMVDYMCTTFDPRIMLDRIRHHPNTHQEMLRAWFNSSDQLALRDD